MFCNSFPNLSRALRIKVIPTYISSFFFDVVKKTVNYREKNNYSRNDFLQLLIDIKNNKGDTTESKGKKVIFVRTDYFFASINPEEVSENVKYHDSNDMQNIVHL